MSRAGASLHAYAEAGPQAADITAAITRLYAKPSG
jgi:hypothetical protein